MKLNACFLVCLGLLGDAVGAELYRSIDADGKITYSDRPAHAGHKPELHQAPNVASPEVSRQIEEEKAALIERRMEEIRQKNTARPQPVQPQQPLQTKRVVRRPPAPSR